MINCKTSKGYQSKSILKQESIVSFCYPTHVLQDLSHLQDARERGIKICSYQWVVDRLLIRAFSSYNRSMSFANGSDGLYNILSCMA